MLSSYIGESDGKLVRMSKGKLFKRLLNSLVCSMYMMISFLWRVTMQGTILMETAMSVMYQFSMCSKQNKKQEK